MPITRWITNIVRMIHSVSVFSKLGCKEGSWGGWGSLRFIFAVKMAGEGFVPDFKKNLYLLGNGRDWYYTGQQNILTKMNLGWQLMKTVWALRIKQQGILQGFLASWLGGSKLLLEN